MSVLISLGWLLLGASLMMIATFIVARIIKNNGIVDVAWSFGFTLAAMFYLWRWQPLGIDVVVICSMMIGWSLRLTSHLAKRFLRMYPHEDPRYTELIEKMGSDFTEAKTLMVFLWQGVVLTVMTVPVAIVANANSDTFGLAQMLSVLVFGIAIIGESVSDEQLSKFSHDAANKGKTCRLGLWKYSRHPNYFFEWLVSVALFIFAIDQPYGFWAVISPIVLLHLLVNVTGVKPSEEHSLKTRTDYAEYRKVTSVFIPWRTRING